MPRPCCLRHIGFTPNTGLFRPVGVPACALEHVTLTLDEVEALRLADLDGLYQDQAAREMGVSRPTFSRIIAAARRKVADALIHGKALRLEGGVVRVKAQGGAGRRTRQGPCRCGRHRGRTTTCAPALGPGHGHESRRKNTVKKGERES